jgi:hypothetical protein
MNRWGAFSFAGTTTSAPVALSFCWCCLGTIGAYFQAHFSDCLSSLESIWTGKNLGSVSSEKLHDAKQSVRIVFYDDDRNTA